ncbi:unnamed protein product [Ectocarpus sp. 12 AP-2014]
MSQEHARASDSVEVARKLKQELDDTMKVALPDPVAMPDVDRMLGHAEFENYIMQLGQTKRFTSFVVALRIVDVQHYRRPVAPCRSSLAIRTMSFRIGATACSCASATGAVRCWMRTCASR